MKPLSSRITLCWNPSREQPLLIFSHSTVLRPPRPPLPPLALPQSHPSRSPLLPDTFCPDVVSGSSWWPVENTKAAHWYSWGCNRRRSPVYLQKSWPFSLQESQTFSQNSGSAFALCWRHVFGFFIFWKSLFRRFWNIFLFLNERFQSELRFLILF